MCWCVPFCLQSPVHFERCDFSKAFPADKRWPKVITSQSIWHQVWQKSIATVLHFQLHEQYTYYLFSYNSSCSPPRLMMWCIVFYSSQDANWAFKVVPPPFVGRGWFILGICWNTTTLLLVSSAVWLADCLFQTMVCHYDLVSMIGKVSSHNCWLHLLYHDCKQYDSYKACLL